MTTNNTFEEPTRQNHGGIGHNSGSGDRPAVELVKLPPDHLVMWEPAVEQASDVPLATIEASVHILENAGQRNPVIARRRGDRIQVVAKGYWVSAVELHNKWHPSTPIEVEVRVFNTMSD